MIQKAVNVIRRQFDYRPVDTKNAPIGDARVERWYRSVGLFEGKKDGKIHRIHLLQAHDKTHLSVLVNGEFKSFDPRTNRVATRFLMSR